MIRAVILFNTNGVPRLVKFYDHYSTEDQKRIVGETFRIVSNRAPQECHFVETSLFNKDGETNNNLLLMYRQYATLYVVFCVDKSENELAILDLIQIFVEVLDRCFESVCELDIIFNMDKIHNILNELIMGGLVLETNIDDIILRYKEQNKMSKSSLDLDRQAAKRAAALKGSLNIEKRFNDIKHNVIANLERHITS